MLYVFNSRVKIAFREGLGGRMFTTGPRNESVTRSGERVENEQRVRNHGYQ